MSEPYVQLDGSVRTFKQGTMDACNAVRSFMREHNVWDAELEQEWSRLQKSDSEIAEYIEDILCSAVLDRSDRITNSKETINAGWVDERFYIADGAWWVSSGEGEME